MCGIFGYFGQPRSAAFLAERIKSLEYRGYDSAGIAFCRPDGSNDSIKDKGNISTILRNRKRDLSDEQFFMGIAHTRWATHGDPCQRNAHPHEFSDFFLIHNGIIENYESLIERFGIRDTQSDTDSEVVGHVFQALLDRSSKENVQDAIRELRGLLSGSYACLIMFKAQPVLLAIRHKSPLIVGIEDESMNVVLSSDVHGFGRFSGKIYQLDDHESVVVNRKNVSVFNGNSPMSIPYQYVDLTPEEMEEESCFFLKEVYDQAHLFSEDLMAHHIRQVKKKLDGDWIPKRVQIIGCGSAYHAALYAKGVFDSFEQFFTEAHIASEFRYRRYPVEKDECHVFVSQSGETADTLESARRSKQETSIRLVSITNHPNNTLSRLTQNNLAMTCGTEVSVAATKTFTAQLKTLLLAGHAMHQSIDMMPVKQLTAFFEQSLPRLFEEMGRHAQDAAKSGILVYLGKDLLLPIAMEGALKVKEIAYVHAEAFACGEIKHGPLALVDKNSYGIVLISEHFFPEKGLNAVEQIKTRGGKVLIVTDSETIKERDPDTVVLLKHNLPYEWVGIPFVVPLQLFAYFVARARSVNIDRPRNLAKSVTVE